MALLPAALSLLVAPIVNQQQARPADLQRPCVHVVRLVVPSLLESDQAKVLCAVRERLTPPVVVAAVAKEEEAGHAIVTEAKEVVKARSATMA